MPECLFSAINNPQNHVFMQENSKELPKPTYNYAILKDDSPMPFGQYKGTAMINVPATYLIWLYDNNQCNKSVKSWITYNLDVLRKQAGENYKSKPASIDKYIKAKR